MAGDVRKQKAAEATVRQLASFAEIYEYVPVALCVLDAQLRFVSLNRRMSLLTGRPAEEDFGRRLEDATPGVAAQLEPHLRRALDGEKVADVELVGTLIGTVCEGRVFLVSVEPLRSAEGNVQGLLCSALDITERKRIEAALREREDHYRHFVELSADMPWTAAPDGGVLEIGTRFLNLTGLSRADAMGTGWARAVHPDDLGPLLESWSCTLQKPRAVDAEFRIRTTEGEDRWIRAAAAPRFDAAGQIMRWYGTIEDIHERKLAALQLRASESFVRSIIASSRDCIGVLDLAGHVQFISEAGLELLAIEDAEEVRGLVWVDVWSPAERDQATAALEEARLGRHARFIGACRGRTGAKMWWDVIVSPITGSDGTAERLLVVSRDVTEHRRAQEEVERVRAGERTIARRLTSVLESTTDSVVVLDRDWRITYANTRAIRGLKPRKLKVGRCLWDLYPEEVDGPFARHYRRAMETGRPVTFQAELGALGIWLQVRAFPSEEGLSIFFRDITAQRRIEQERKATQERIEHLARHDPLTGLINRLTLKEQLERHLASLGDGEKLAIHYIDLDGFKLVNDTMGHAAGDQLLVAFANRIKKLVRGTAVLSRLGGDEFAILQPSVTRNADAAQLAANVLDALSKPFAVGGQQVMLGASIGIAIGPEDGRCGENLLKSSDVALYQAKAQGRRNFMFFEPSMGDAVRHQQNIRMSLHGALQRREFDIAFQPLVALDRGRVKCFEALLRWPRSPLGDIGPSSFIPAAEETGFINGIGEWVLNEACREAVKWPRDVRIAVNLSPVQFLNPGLFSTISNALATSGLEPNRLELEVTESVLLRDAPCNLQLLERLRGMGVRIVLDDFGTGYSSLGYLLRFAFDKIKIDRSFIEGLPERETSKAILRAVIGMGQSMGVTIAAEGVETTGQLNVLREEGCHEAQGFLFSAPVSKDRVSSCLQFSLRPTLVA